MIKSIGMDAVIDDRDTIVTRIRAAIAKASGVGAPHTPVRAVSDGSPSAVSEAAPTRSPHAAAKIELAKRTIMRLRNLAFRVHLGDSGEILVDDTAGNCRDATRHAPKLFEEIAAGLAEEPKLLDRV